MLKWSLKNLKVTKKLVEAHAMVGLRETQPPIS